MNTLKNHSVRSWVIYTLSDPRSNGEIRYVGVTHQPPQDRLKTHIYLARTGKTRTHTSYWIGSLLGEGLEPTLRVIDSGVGSGWEDSEKYWISKYKEQGANLTNHTDGGEGSLGCPCSPETRAKLRASKLGRRLTDDHKEKISKAGMGRKPTPEIRVKLRLAKLGNNPSPETRAKISSSNKGKSPTPEARAKLSAAGKGREKSPETLAKLSASIKESWKTRPRKLSPETRMKMSLSHIKREPDDFSEQDNADG